MRFRSSHIALPGALALAILLLVVEPALGQREVAMQTNGVLNLLVPIPSNVESNISQAALQDSVYAAKRVNLPMHAMVGVWSRAFARAGYDYNLSLYQALKGAGVAQYEELKAYGGIAYVIPFLNALKDGRRDVMLQSGWVGEATVDAAVRFGTAIGFLSDEKVPLAAAAGAVDEGELASLSARVRGLVQLADSIVFVWLETPEGEDLGEFYFDAESAECQEALEEGAMAFIEYAVRDGSNWIEVCRKADGPTMQSDAQSDAQTEAQSDAQTSEQTSEQASQMPPGTVAEPAAQARQ